MKNRPSLLNSVFNTIAPAHARRKRARATEPAMIFDFSVTENRAAREPEAAQAQLQADHAARRADEMRSAF